MSDSAGKQTPQSSGLLQPPLRQAGAGSISLTLVGAVGVSLVTVISTVVVAVAGPVLRDAAAAVAFKLDTRARMAAAGFVAVVAAVVVCHVTRHSQLVGGTEIRASWRTEEV